MDVASSVVLFGKRSRSPSLQAIPLHAKCQARHRDRNATIDGDNISECTLYCASPVPFSSPSFSLSPSPSPFVVPTGVANGTATSPTQAASHLLAAAQAATQFAPHLAPQAGTAAVTPTPVVNTGAVAHDTALVPQPRVARTADLPDEVLVSLLRFVRSARALAGLRAVCKRWRGVIDGHAAVWRNASFSGAVFSRPVVIARDALARGAHGRMPLELGPRAGLVAVSLAANAGNEWAQFLRAAVFDGAPLRAVTVAQPAATLLVSGASRSIGRDFPPWGDGAPPACARNVRTGRWVAVHASRAISPQLAGLPQYVLAMPRGALVGMVYVSQAYVLRTAGAVTGKAKWQWKIDRHVQLVRPMRCAGFVGLWTLSEYMTEYFVRALHSQ